MKKTVLLVLVLALGLAAEVANADFTFGEPTNLGPTVNTSYSDVDPHISADGLTLFFDSDRPGGSGDWDIWIATRPTINDFWEEPVNPGPAVNSPYEDGMPCVSADRLELYFYSKRPGGYGGIDIWLTRRPTFSDPWGDAMNLGPPVNTSSHEFGLAISANGLELYFSSRRAGGLGSDDIWVTKRATKNDLWGEPVNLGATVNGSASDLCSSISADGLILFFSSHANGPFPTGGYGGPDIWMTTRPTRDDPWGPSRNLGSSVNTVYAENYPSISADGRWLYFCDWSSHRPGGYGSDDIWRAPIIPVVDFNGDGIVDSADMCIMVDHWHTDEPLCDIGPTPLGDGIVDIQDLIALAEHLFEELNDPTLVAHLALDETEGDIASDSANDNDGTVYGDLAWQPEGGIVDGALQLDGIDDYVNTLFVLNPADGKFSVFVWIKGGAPGQAVLSQMGGARWLCADPSDGNLMTELKASGRGSAELLSQTVITDGNWHRIGLVWDGSHRTLYVDDVAVAEDTRGSLEISQSGLYIGTGKAMKSGTYWSGLIDDVRIYNRAVTP